MGDGNTDSLGRAGAQAQKTSPHPEPRPLHPAIPRAQELSVSKWTAPAQSCRIGRGGGGDGRLSLPSGLSRAKAQLPRPEGRKFLFTPGGFIKCFSVASCLAHTARVEGRASFNRETQ